MRPGICAHLKYCQIGFFEHDRHAVGLDRYCGVAWLYLAIDYILVAAVDVIFIGHGYLLPRGMIWGMALVSMQELAYGLISSLGAGRFNPLRFSPLSPIVQV